jgi:hypothetical protein
VFEVVYMDRRELKCAYIGCSNLPLAYDSLADNLMIVALADPALQHDPNQQSAI